MCCEVYSNNYCGIKWQNNFFHSQRKFLVRYKIKDVLFNSGNCILTLVQVCLMIEKIIPKVALVQR